MNTPALLKEIEQLQAKTLQNTIDLLNQKKLWKIRAQRLANKHQACLDCGASAKSNPNLVWIAEIRLCSKCQQKEVSHE
jgi:hypothetical protein